MNLSTPSNLLTAALYWIFVGFIALFSLFGVYDLIRYGKSLIFGLILGLIYGFFFLTLLFQSYNLLKTLLA